MKKGRYYVYSHTRLDKNEVFYIGVGTKPPRCTDEGAEYSRAILKHRKTGRGSIWYRIKAKTEYTVQILFESDSYQEVLDKEIELIKLHGRINIGTGTLSNLTDGGKGMVGFKHSDESKKKMSISKTGTKRALGITERIINTRKARNYKHSEETKKKMSLAAFARYNNKNKIL